MFQASFNSRVCLSLSFVFSSVSTVHIIICYFFNTFSYMFVSSWPCNIGDAADRERCYAPPGELFTITLLLNLIFLELRAIINIHTYIYILLGSSFLVLYIYICFIYVAYDYNSWSNVRQL